eukprot:3436612-Amphidinium_carterae.1
MALLSMLRFAERDSQIEHLLVLLLRRVCAIYFFTSASPVIFSTSEGLRSGRCGGSWKSQPPHPGSRVVSSANDRCALTHPPRVWTFRSPPTSSTSKGLRAVLLHPCTRVH